MNSPTPLSARPLSTPAPDSPVGPPSAAGAPRATTFGQALDAALVVPAPVRVPVRAPAPSPAPALHLGLGTPRPSRTSTQVPARVAAKPTASGNAPSAVAKAAASVAGHPKAPPAGHSGRSPAPPDPRVSTAPAKPSATDAGSSADAAPSAKGVPAALDAAQAKIVYGPAAPERVAVAARELHVGPVRSQGAATSKPAAISAQHSASAAPRSYAPAFVVAPRSAAAPPPTRELDPLLDHAHLDPSLRLNLTSDSAQISLEAGKAGSLFAQLRIANGVADVRIGGEAAALLTRHGAELSLGLNATGLQPGRIEISPAASPTGSRSPGSDSGTASGSSGQQSSSQPGGGGSTDGQRSPEPPLSSGLASVSKRTTHIHIKA